MTVFVVRLYRALVEHLQGEISHLRGHLAEKDNQLTRRDEQIDQLQQLLAISQKSIQQLTEQKLLEDERGSWWKRLFGRQGATVAP